MKANAPNRPRPSLASASFNTTRRQEHSRTWQKCTQFPNPCSLLLCGDRASSSSDESPPLYTTWDLEHGEIHPPRSLEHVVEREHYFQSHVRLELPLDTNEQTKKQRIDATIGDIRACLRKSKDEELRKQANNLGEHVFQVTGPWSLYLYFYFRNYNVNHLFHWGRKADGNHGLVFFKGRVPYVPPGQNDSSSSSTTSSSAPSSTASSTLSRISQRLAPAFRSRPPPARPMLCYMCNESHERKVKEEQAKLVEENKAKAASEAQYKSDKKKIQQEKHKVLNNTQVAEHAAPKGGGFQREGKRKKVVNDIAQD